MQYHIQLGTNKFISLLDKAYLQVSSGAFSFDVEIQNVVEELAKEGLGMVEYTSGAHRQLDTAVRTAIRTAVNQNAGACQLEVMDELEVNLVETSSHFGARPEHAAWQGRVFWRNYQEGTYENFEKATGYGTGPGLMGWNCRHSFGPYFEEVGQTAEPIDGEENERVYQLTQRQRYNERKIREWSRRKQIMEAAGLDSTKEKYKLKEWHKINEELIKENKDVLKQYYAREKGYFSSKDKNVAPRIGHKEDLTGYKMDFSTKQDKHYPGTKLYEESVKNGKYPSYFTISKEELRDIILKHVQKGYNQYTKKQRWRSRETILDNDKIIGYAVNERSGDKIETKYFTIHYSKEKGFHAVPDFPSKGALKNESVNKR